MAMAVSAEAEYWQEGHSGASEADAYIIDSLEDFMTFKAKAGMEHWGEINDIEQKYYRLETDIDLTGADWGNNGIGYPVGFRGHFDGNGKTITVQDFPSAIFFALSPDEGVAVKNLNIKGNIKATGYYAAALAVSLNSGIVEGCTFEGSITLSAKQTAFAGGLIGSVSGTVRNCKFSGSVELQKNTDTYIAELGGIAGGLEDGGRIENCTVSDGLILSYTGTKGEQIGGIVGWAIGTANISGNSFTGTTNEIGLDECDNKGSE